MRSVASARRIDRDSSRKTSLMRCIVAVTALVTLLNAGCSRSPDCCTEPPTNGNIKNNSTGRRWVFLWIAAVKDTSIDSTEAGRSSGCDPELRVGYLSELNRRTYVDFRLPKLPKGYEINEAYLNLYHPANRADGTTDSVHVPVARSSRPWGDPCKLTWTNANTPLSVRAEFRVALKSQAWSGSQNIKDTVKEFIDGPSSSGGFIVHFESPELRGQKSFHSNNHSSRTPTSLGLAPRLLLRVHLPAGTTAEDITLPPLPVPNDLGEVLRSSPDPQPDSVLMVEIEDGTRTGRWPPAWDVAIFGVR